MDPAHQAEALRAANQALSGSRRHALPLAPVDVRSLGSHHGGWDLAAALSVAAVSVLTVIGLWFL